MENPLVTLSVTVSISVPLYLKRTAIKTLKDRCENCMLMLLRRFSNCSTPVKCYLFKTYCSNSYCAPPPCEINTTVTAIEEYIICTL